MAAWRARVLVVEDAEAIRAAVLAGLTEAGFGAPAAPDGRALEDDLAAFRPDLVVLDIMLPGRDGSRCSTWCAGTATPAW